MKQKEVQSSFCQLGHFSISFLIFFSHALIWVNLHCHNIYITTPHMGCYHACDNNYDDMCSAGTMEDDRKSEMIPLLSPFVVGGFQSTTFALLLIYF